MSLAYYIVPEREVPGLDCFVNGKSLAHIPGRVLDRICRQAGVRPLTEFLSSGPEEDAEFFEEEGIDPPPGGFPPVQWFEPADGLRTVRGLLTRVSELAAVADRGYGKGVEEDLRQYEEVLVGLEQAGVRWHLEVDS
jgi:hypothetical protein